jgi:hypothetical protein
MDRALDRLKAAVSMASVRKAVELPDGSEFEFWMTPLTLAQRAKAQKASGDDATAFALQLLVTKATDESGTPLFVQAEMAELRNALPAKVVDELLLALLDANKKEEEDEEEEELSPKPSAKRSRTTQS